MNFQMARRTQRMGPSIIRELLKLTEQPGIISLAGGLPSPETFPIEALRAATERVLRGHPRESLQYAASEGFAPCGSGSSTNGARKVQMDRAAVS